VPGESYLAVLDGFHRHREQIRFITCRQEGGAAFLAEAHGKLSGRPGVCLVTRGPGATNASIGVHTAFQDSTPMVLLVGDVGSDFRDREAFQEVDFQSFFGPSTKAMAKRVERIDDARRIPEYIARAFATAMNGRPGPVVLVLPEDMLTQTVDAEPLPRVEAVQAWSDPGALRDLRQLLLQSQRPLVIAGGGGWTPQAAQALQRFAENWQLPVGNAFRFQDTFDNHHPLYAGDVGIGINPRLAARIREADLVLAIGPRLGEMTTSGYTLFEVPIPRQAIAHVHPGNDELGRVYQTRWMINASMPAFMDALIKESDAISLASNDFVQRKQLIDEARAQYERWQEQPPASQQAVASGSVDPWLMVQALRAIAPADTILTNGAGNFATWAHRFWRYGPMRSQLAPTSGAMGYGIPAAVAAAICYPERSVVCFAGDGDFLMTAQEFATAIQYQAGFVVIVFNNSMYGTIRMHQERDYPARVYGTNLVNPDFARYAEAFGGWGFVVTENDQIGQALEQALAFARSEKKPAVVELRLSQQIITPNLTIEQLRGKAVSSQKS